MWFPKKNDNEILNLVAQLNAMLQGSKYKVVYSDRKYALLPNDINFELEHSLCCENLTFGEMKMYLIGLIYGIKLQAK